MNYYNEFDPKAAAWLRELISRGLIPPGYVDERSITEIHPDELSPYTQCHFFAGIGGWPLALQLAGVPPTRPLWSGSCPCPPFSTAGKAKLCPACGGKPIPHPLKTGIFACVPCGHEWLADDRHLYPEFLRLIAHCRPSIVFGEQVAGNDGLVWLTGVRSTLERIAYGFGASDLCAPGKASPHLRQRLFWMAHTRLQQSERRGIAGELASQSGQAQGEAQERKRSEHAAGDCRQDGRLADAERSRREETRLRSEIDTGRESESGRASGRMGNTNGERFGSSGREEQPFPNQPGHGALFGLADDHSSRRDQGRAGEPPAGYDGPFGDGFWADSRFIECRDGKLRRIPTEPALFPLADGLPYKLARRGSIRPALLKGAGNAIIPEVAADFIVAALRALEEVLTHAEPEGMKPRN